jgi:excisionase family DNA binding protein
MGSSTKPVKRLDFDSHSSVNVHDMSDITLLTIEEACQILNLGHSLFYDLIRDKKLRTVKINTRRLVSIKSLRELVANMEEENETS